MCQHPFDRRLHVKSGENYSSGFREIWPCRKRIKGQPMIIIWTNLVEFESSMLYTKIPPKSFLGSGEEHFQEFLPYMDMVAILCNCAEPFKHIGNTLSTEWYLVKIAQAVSENKTFKNYTILYMFIAQWQGQITFKGQKFDYKIQP